MIKRRQININPSLARIRLPFNKSSSKERIRLKPTRAVLQDIRGPDLAQPRYHERLRAARDDDCASAAELAGGHYGSEAGISAGGDEEVDIFVFVCWVCEGGEDEVADAAG